MTIEPGRHLSSQAVRIALVTCWVLIGLAAMGIGVIARAALGSAMFVAIVGVGLVAVAIGVAVAVRPTRRTFSVSLIAGLALLAVLVIVRVQADAVSPGMDIFVLVAMVAFSEFARRQVRTPSPDGADAEGSAKESRIGPVLITVAAVVLGFAVVLTFVPLVGLGVVFRDCAFNPNTFDVAAWASADPYETCSDRSGMVEDVRANYLTPGMSEPEVRAILGTPDDESERTELSWAIGCWIDCDWLVVRFGDDERLVETYTTQD